MKVVEVNTVKNEFLIYPMKFKIARVIKNFTLDEVAVMAGITRKTISKIVKGECKRISKKTFDKLTNALGQKSEFFTTDVE